MIEVKLEGISFLKEEMQETVPILFQVIIHQLISIIIGDLIMSMLRKMEKRLNNALNLNCYDKIEEIEKYF